MHKCTYIGGLWSCTKCWARVWKFSKYYSVGLDLFKFRTKPCRCIVLSNSVVNEVFLHWFTHVKLGDFLISCVIRFIEILNHFSSNFNFLSIKYEKLLPLNLNVSFLFWIFNIFSVCHIFPRSQIFQKFKS